MYDQADLVIDAELSTYSVTDEGRSGSGRLMVKRILKGSAAESIAFDLRSDLFGVMCSFDYLQPGDLAEERRYLVFRLSHGDLVAYRFYEIVHPSRATDWYSDWLAGSIN
jgi:hypothetical protein